MRRRLLDCGKLKRLPPRKPRAPEPVQGNSYIHWKLLAGWLALILFDSLAQFRIEYLYPVVMFIRSVYDSYKYQGLVFAMLFICLVVYLDLLCWTVLTGPWLFLGASSCVWLEIMRNIGLDHAISYSAVTLWMLFLYIEVSHRLHSLPHHLLNLSRPFAAHCIGYPVVTVSFLIKHQITHIIRQRQQKRVTEENSVFFDILSKALPPPVQEETTDSTQPGGVEDVSGTSNSTNHHTVHNHTSSTSTVSVEHTNSNSSSGGSGKSGSKISPKSSSGGSNSKASQKSQSSSSRHRPNSSGLRSSSSSSSATTHDSSIAAKVSSADPGSPVGSGGSLANGDLPPRPPSAGKVHLPSGKKQATVRAVPRVDLPPTSLQDKTKLLMESLQQELKQEHQSRVDAEITISQLELEVKKLKADLHASCLQEEETTSRVDQLVSLEKSHKVELQRLRTESDSLHNKLLKLNSNKYHDQAAISDLEKRLKEQVEYREKIEAELRDHRHATRNLWSETEVKDLQDKLAGKEKELDLLKKELQKRDKSSVDLRKEIGSLRGALKVTEEANKQLKGSLADETRVKIEVFTALSDASKKYQSVMEECRRKDTEIHQLRQSLAEIMAIIPGLAPAPPSGGSTGGGGYPPASSPQH